MTFSPGPASFIRGPKSALPSNTRGGSRVPEWGPLGSVRGALSNERPYRDLENVVAKYPFERPHKFPGIQPNSGHRDYSRLSCRAGEMQLGPLAPTPADGVAPNPPSRYVADARPSAASRTKVSPGTAHLRDAST